MPSPEDVGRERPRSRRNNVLLVMGHLGRDSYVGLADVHGKPAEAPPEGMLRIRIGISGGMSEHATDLGPMGARELGEALLEWASREEARCA